jgi:hypothetical protein
MEPFLATLTLVVLSPALAELTTSSTLLVNFITPGTFFLLVIFAYGLPVLVIREVATRYHLNYIGLFFLGIAFGIYSEGLIAKTLILSNGLPAPEYNNYGYILGVSIPFAVAISIWHAVAAVVLPIYATHHLFPQKKSIPWLPKWLSILLGCTLILVGVANVLHPNKGTVGSLTSVVTLLMMMALSVIVGLKLGKKTIVIQETSTDKNIKPFILGLLAIIYFSFTFLAQDHLPVIIFLLILAGAVYVYYKKFASWVTTDQGIILFGCGFYLQQAVIALFLRLTQGVTSIFSAVIPLLIFIIMISFFVRKISKKSLNV